MKAFCEKYDLVVTCVEHSILSRNIINCCNMLGIDTALIMDGTYEYENANNNPYLKKMNFKLLDNTKFNYIFSVDKMMERYINSLGAKFIHYFPKHARVDKNMEPPILKRLLLTTANSSYFNESEFDELVCLLKKIRLFLENSGIEFKFRVYDDKIIKELNINEDENDILLGFAETIKKYSHVISTPSTIINSSINANRPTAVLMYRDAPITQPAGWIISNSVSLDKTFSSFLKPCKNRMSFQQRFCGGEFQEFDEFLKDKLASKEKDKVVDEALCDFINLSIEYRVRCMKSNVIFKKIIAKVKSF